MRRYLLCVIVLFSIYLVGCQDDSRNDLYEGCNTYSEFSELLSNDLYNELKDVNSSSYVDIVNNLKNLDIYSDESNEFDFNGLRCFQNIESIKLSGSAIKDISELSKLKELKTVELDSTNIISINSLINSNQISSLSIKNSPLLQDLDGIYNMKRLTSLELIDSNIVDIKGIKNLERLESLNLSNNNIIDIEPIKDLINMKEIELSNNDIKNINEFNLSKLNQLEKISLSNNLLDNIDFLEGAKKLKYLYIDENNFSNNISLFTKLKGLQLEVISANRSFINNINSLEDMFESSLMKLNLEDNDLDVVTPLRGYDTLNELVLSGNALDDINPLKELVSLKNIDLSNNNISNLCPIISITGISNIVINDNLLSDISCVNNHYNLTNLDVSFNDISVLDNFNKLSSLVSFDFKGQTITKIRNSFNNMISLDNTNFKLDIDTSNLEIESSFNSLSVINYELDNLDINSIDMNSFNSDYINKLDISNNNLLNINFIKNIDNIRVIDASLNNINDIEVFKNDNDFELHISDINLSSNKIALLDGHFNKLVNLENLDLSNCLLIEISNSLNNFHDINYINLENNNIEIIENVFNKINISKINFINSITIVNEIKSFFNDSKIENDIILNGLDINAINSSFINSEVRNLDISNSNLTQLGLMFGYFKADNVNLSLNKLTNIDFLDNGVNISELNLSENIINDISGLNNIIGLTKLDISNNQFSGDLSFMNNELSNSLKILNLSNAIDGDTITGLNGFINLLEVDISYNSFKNINNFINNQKILMSINIDGNSNLESINNSFNDLDTKNLSLDFSSKKIKDINDSFINTNAYDINFSDNVITNIKGSFVLSNITELNLESNELDEGSIDDLNKLSQLDTLILSRNLFVEFVNLDINTLLNLDLNYNNISNISDLKTPKLKSLLLDSNQISNLVFLNDLLFLEELVLSNNKLRTVNSIINFENLQDLQVDGNDLGNYLTGLNNLPNLISLNISISIVLNSEYNNFMNGLNSLQMLNNEDVKNGINNILDINHESVVKDSFNSTKINNIKLKNHAIDNSFNYVKTLDLNNSDYDNYAFINNFHKIEILFLVKLDDYKLLNINFNSFINLKVLSIMNSDIKIVNSLFNDSSLVSIDLETRYELELIDSFNNSNLNNVVINSNSLKINNSFNENIELNDIQIKTNKDFVYELSGFNNTTLGNFRLVGFNNLTKLEGFESSKIDAIEFYNNIGLDILNNIDKTYLSDLTLIDSEVPSDVDLYNYESLKSLEYDNSDLNIKWLNSRLINQLSTISLVGSHTNEIEEFILSVLVNKDSSSKLSVSVGFIDYKLGVFNLKDVLINKLEDVIRVESTFKLETEIKETKRNELKKEYIENNCINIECADNDVDFSIDIKLKEQSVLDEIQIELENRIKIMANLNFVEKFELV